MQKIERRESLNSVKFIKEYMAKNRPVIITDAMNDWNINSLWTPSFLIENFGSELTQLYDHLFNIQGLITLEEYINKYFNREICNDDVVPYIRWYGQFKDLDFVWADEFFNKIKSNWQLPYFLPRTNYLLPYEGTESELDPNKDMFPAKGLFISAKGARTRLHYDPWCSDAVLCQIHGDKKIILYDPSQKSLLTNDNEFVDIDKPDQNKFPEFDKAIPTYIDMLAKGEIVYFPHNWLHHVETVNDSISLTWNFVHLSTWPDFYDYLIKNPSPSDIGIINFFLKKI